MSTMKNRTVFITGGSRGIGRAIALACAREGANVVIGAKSDEPHPKLPGTIHSVAEEIRQAGGQALPLVLDVRDEKLVRQRIDEAANHFGGIDALVNNAGAIKLTGVENLKVSRYDLMHQVNGRGTFLVSKACIPHLKQAANPHVLALSPPLDLSPHWFGSHVAYSMAKYNMSLAMLGMAEEFKGDGIAFNALWPRTAVATAAIEFALTGKEGLAHCRTPEILADAAHALFCLPARENTGRFLIDDSFLYEQGVRDFDVYRVDPTKSLMPDFFVPADSVPPPGVKIG